MNDDPKATIALPRRDLDRHAAETYRLARSYAEFRDATADCAEAVALRFAKLWGGTLEWVRPHRLFRLGRTLYATRFRDGAWEVAEAKGYGA